MQTRTFIRKLCSRYIWLNLALMAALMMLLVLLLGWAAAVYTHHGEEISVPDICNKKFPDAENLLEAAGLTIVVSDTSYNRHLPPDCILQQSPDPGQKVKSGRVVYVTINASTKPTLVMPDIVDNSSLREAMAKLRILGFKVGEPQYVAGEKDWVYGAISRGQRLSTGDKVSIDAMVTLLVGNGMVGDDADLEVTDPDMEPVDEGEEVPEEDPFQVVEE
ncbi:PASTA domain-containing protein [Prevotella loescheii]|nr:PASTA domain-containing protein [Hoylesella loescheii]